jgi:hypothetical protein
MKYYVPVGPGGVFFRVGMAVTGIMGSFVYWRASRRRGDASELDAAALATQWSSTTSGTRNSLENPGSDSRPIPYAAGRGASWAWFKVG